MSKPFLNSINYMRGICMLGVIGIHVGSIALVNPTPNLALVALTEILSRFSVPAFFFLSAFGMFYSQPLAEPFSYGSYLKRRLRTVLVPYLFWSFFYMAFTALTSHNYAGLQGPAIVKTLWYGLAMYHIYFLVILLWFYFLMPVWRKMLLFMERSPLLWFSLLFLVNMVFNFYSSYLWDFKSSQPWLQDAFNYRLNYVVLHYVFIFLFGAFCAEHFQALKSWISQHGTCINVLQIVASLGMLAAYYGVMHYLHYDALSAVYTVHQLSPVGMVYTVSSMLFFLYWWECRHVPSAVHLIFSNLGDYSYPIYLVHPVFLSFLTGLAHHYHILLRAWHVVVLYFLVAGLALAFSALLPRLHLPKALSICLKGK